MCISRGLCVSVLHECPCVYVYVYSFYVNVCLCTHMYPCVIMLASSILRSWLVKMHDAANACLCLRCCSVSVSLKPFYVVVLSILNTEMLFVEAVTLLKS